MDIRNSEDKRFFVADLLYLYESFDIKLLTPLLNSAIHHNDPSFNRIFLFPCVHAFGIEIVIKELVTRFQNTDLIERIGIAKLVYWLRRKTNENECELLCQELEKKAQQTENLVELFYYKLALPKDTIYKEGIPDNADELIDAVKGDKDLEFIIFEKLNWSRNSERIKIQQSNWDKFKHFFGNAK